jgi:rare lipoprotein A
VVSTEPAIRNVPVGGIYLAGHPEVAAAGEGPAVVSSPRGLSEYLVRPTRRSRARLELFRAALLICIAAGLLLLPACGHKKTARNVPPPPTVTPGTASTSSTQASTKPSAPSLETGRHQKPIYVETGLASWYGPPYHNRKGANGEIYDQNALTAAHRTLPMNSVVRVTNESTKHAVVVRITDRGPFIEDRMIDLSLAAAKAVDVWRPGTATVKIEVLSTPAPISEGGRWCVQIGAFQSRRDALKLKEKLQDHYQDAQVIEFTGPTGEWVRIRPQGDDKRIAQEVASKTHVKEGGVFLVRLD